MVAWWGAVLGQLHATFVDSSPGGGRALSLVALLVAQPLALLVALLVGQAVAPLVALLSVVRTKRVQLPNVRRRLAWWLVVGCWNGEGRHAVWRCRPSGFVVLWRCPTLPQPIGCSTIGAAGLSFQVRNGAGRFPGAVTTTRFSVQHAPPPAGGVWVDRGVHSGCGIVLPVLFHPS